MLDFQKRKLLNYLLLPLSWIYILLSFLNRFYQSKKQEKINVPIIIVGNITVGGTGKSPLTIAIVQFLIQKNYKVGVVSRGYGGTHQKGSLLLDKSTSPIVAGDEPVMIYQQTQVPVIVNKNRVKAVKDLIKYHKVNVIISDDGLQHYALSRDIEIVVIDGKRRFGNGFFLPAGPLREKISRLQSVDFIVNNGSYENNETTMFLTPLKFTNLKTSEVQEIDFFAFEKCYVVSGIANPKRFWETLKKLQIRLETRSFADHYKFTKDDFIEIQDMPIIMTDKDAVKCLDFATENMWSLTVKASLEDDFYKSLLRKINVR
ncbi:Tetraacyldisaccharide 4'-kinase [hydrothermal vent metagenome]|uniref:tetraacyldisaccharide 4'-kinase n=1 Tax=hydrothermal vent metagenome TaxID=652676 RepID=A0A1W1CUG4_9ZZZZ